MLADIKYPPIFHIPERLAEKLAVKLAEKK